MIKKKRREKKNSFQKWVFFFTLYYQGENNQSPAL